MRYLTIAEVLYLHRMVIAQAGGASGIRDLGGLESATAQPLEELILAVADGSLSREGLLRWVDAHIRPRTRPS